MSELNDWNRRVIEEFRANDGAVEQFKGMTILLLHHTGAKSGKAYTNPLAYAQEGDRYYVFASKAGADHHPDWYHNLVAHPDVTIEVGTESLAATARVATGDERTRIWETQKAKRTIPVVAFDPA
jgi:deazaflavin-dependent oxidoreductase (nitroreductase family)